MEFYTSFLSEVGGRKNNEDYCSYVYKPNEYGCWVVADGLGGHEGGEIASSTAVQGIISKFSETYELSGENLEQCMIHANQLVVNEQEKNKKLASMRTTAVALFSDCSHIRWSHIGDSRLYMFRDGKIIFQTKDHSVSQTAVNIGEITQDQIRFHEDRNKLLRVLGCEDRPRLETLGSAMTLENGDAFLLCTDGFWEYVLEMEMEIELTKAKNPEDWLKRMTERLLKKVDDQNDNYTAIAVFTV